jgi:glycerol-3-phosphate dehydrogenase
MKKNVEADVVIIGAGAVGCAIARHLSIVRPDKKIVVLEKLDGTGMETSCKNSGVLHSGLHQNPKFLKSKLARIGSKMAAEFMKKNNYPILDCGMIVAVSGESFLGGPFSLWSLMSLMKRGREQNINFDFLTSSGLRKLEPNIKALGGIFIPNVWVVDSKQFVGALHKEAEDNGVEFFFNNPVEEICTFTDYYWIFTPHFKFRTPIIINAAGLYADDVAHMAGFNQYKIYPWRGEYYEVIGEKKNLIKRLIYPAVPPYYPGKGIHLGPRVDGRLFIGPNARPVPRKNFYEEDKTPVEVFLKAAKRFLPQIEAGDLKWAYSGIRPKTTNDSRENDFIISLDRQSPPMVNLIGIESPGLASAMAIGQYVDWLLSKYLYK